jgi:hypothetical protein
MNTDITLAYHGSVVLVHPRTPAGTAWIDDHVDPEAQRWVNALVVEPRYVEALAEGMIADGLSVGQAPGGEV